MVHVSARPIARDGLKHAGLTRAVSGFIPAFEIGKNHFLPI